MPDVRVPAVAGQFYEADPERLRRSVRGHLRTAPAPAPAAGSGRAPKALIVPHAGYVYSGPIAGSAYAQLEALRGRVERVVLLGPAHRVYLRGLASPAAEAFETPLGRIRIDREALAAIADLPQMVVSSEAHLAEHSLEVQLPFLQETLGDFSLVPLVVGQASGEEVAEVLERLWGGEETLIVVSSDLSHYYDYTTACRLDAQTSRAIESLRPEAIDEEGACGRIPVQGLLIVAARHGLSARVLDVRNSGDTAGLRDRVVGYGAYAFA